MAGEIVKNYKILTALCICGLIFALIGMCSLVAWVIYRNHWPELPKLAESAYFPNVTVCNLKADNPRQLGKKYYFPPGHADDFIARHETRLNPTDVEEREYVIQIVQFVRMRNGSLRVPWMHIMVILEGGTTHDTEFQSPLRPNSPMGVPLDKEIISYVFLVRGVTEQTGWRYLEVPATIVVSASDDPDYPGSKLVSVPDLLTLPRAEESEEGRSLLDLYARADEAFSAAGGHY